MSGSSATNINDLFQTATDDAVVQNLAPVVLSNVDLGAQIQAALGTPADDVKASSVTLPAFLIDDSGSVAPFADVIRKGYNACIQALGKTKQAEGIFLHTRLLNGAVIQPFRPLKTGPSDPLQAVLLTPANYQAHGGTPLYDATVVLLGAVAAKTLEYERAGIAVQTVSVIITDGQDLHSHRSTVHDVAKLVGDLRNAERHVICGMGIGDEQEFRRVFAAMNIPSEWILTPAASEHELIHAFGLVTQSAVRLSQVSAGGFSRAAAGGFGASP